MAKVHITQLLCPRRHCIVGFVWEEGGRFNSPEDACREVQALVAKLGFDPWCGICHSRDLRAEDGLTKFRSLKEAEPELARLQTENILTRMRIEAARQS
jgi:hypothetical protein